MKERPDVATVAAARTRWLRVAVLLVIYGALLLAGHWVSDWGEMIIEMDIQPFTQSSVDRMVVGALVLYVALLALPFVPGVEIGMGLLMLMGPEVCLLVYFATLAGLGLSYCVGRLLPIRLIAALFGTLGLARAQAFVRRIEPLDGQARIELMSTQAPKRFVPHLLRYRYLALLVAVNLPGNSFIGGGGGIALAAGMSRMFRFPFFFATLALAVAPVPLAVYLMGK